MWMRCRKKPVEVKFRYVKPGENGVETLEGFKPCDPGTHFIIKGVEDEEYPIRMDIFYKTYDVIDQTSNNSRKEVEK